MNNQTSEQIIPLSQTKSILVSSTKESKTEKITQKQIENMLKMTKYEREQMFTDLFAKCVEEDNVSLKLKKVLHEKSTNQISNFSKEQPKNDNTENSKQKIDKLKNQFEKMKNENKKLQLKLRMLQVKNPQSENRTQSHPWLKDTKDTKDDSHFFGLKNRDKMEVTFKTKHRMIEFIKQLESRMIKEGIEIYDFDQNKSKSPEKAKRERISLQKSLTKNRNQFHENEKKEKTRDGNGLRDTIESRISLKQSEMDDLAMLVLEKEDEVEMTDKQIRELEIEKSELKIREIDLEKSIRKIQVTKSDKSNLQNEITLLKEKERILKSRFEELKNSPLMSVHESFEEMSRLATDKENELIKLKSDVQRLSYLQSERKREVEKTEQLVSAQSEELKQKEARWREISAVKTLESEKQKFDVILSKVIPSDNQSKLDQIYADLMKVLTHNLGIRSSLMDAKGEKSSNQEIERHERETVQLRAVLNNLNRRLIECCISIEDSKTKHANALRDLVSRNNKSHSDYVTLRSLCLYVSMLRYPNNQTPLTEYLTFGNPFSFQKTISGKPSLSCLLDDFRLIPDTMILLVKNIDLNFENSEEFKIQIFSNFNGTENTMFGETAHDNKNSQFSVKMTPRGMQNKTMKSISAKNWREEFADDDPKLLSENKHLHSFDHCFKLDLKKKSDFMKLVESEVNLRIMLERRNKKQFNFFSKLNIGSTLDDCLMKTLKLDLSNSSNWTQGFFVWKGFSGANCLDDNDNKEFRGFAINEQVGKFEYKICLSSSQQLSWEKNVTRTFNKKTVDTLGLKISSIFGVNKSSFFKVRIVTDESKISNLKLLSPDLQISPSQTGLVNVTNNKLVSGPNPSFDIHLEFDLVSDNQIDPFQIHIFIQECLSLTGGFGEENKVTISVNHLYVHEKQCRVIPIVHSSVMLNKRRLLYALFNANHYKNDVRVFDTIYPKSWFLNTLEKISKHLKFKHAQKEIILPFVFSEQKKNISCNDFLSNIFNSSRVSMSNAPLKGVISTLGEQVVFFQNGFEFDIFWDYVCDAEKVHDPKKSEMIEAGNDSEKLENIKNSKLNELKSISFNFFKFLFFEVSNQFSNELKTQTESIKKNKEEKGDKSSGIQNENKRDLILTENDSLGGNVLKLKQSLAGYMKKNQRSQEDVIRELDPLISGTIPFDKYFHFVDKLCSSESLRLTDAQIRSTFLLFPNIMTDVISPASILKLVECDVEEVLKFDKKNEFFDKKYDEIRKTFLIEKFSKNTKRFVRKNDLSFVKLLDTLELYDCNQKGVKNIKIADFLRIAKLINKNEPERTNHETFSEENKKVENENENEIEEFQLAEMFNEFDQGKIEGISIEEICDKCELNSLFKIIEDGNDKTLREETLKSFLTQLYTHCCDMTMPMTALVEKMDSEMTGTISRTQIFGFFKFLESLNKLKLEFSHFEAFMSKLNLTSQKTISPNEVRTVFQEFENSKKVPKEISKEEFKRVLVKLHEFIKIEDFRLRICFECEEDQKGLIKLEKFKEVIAETGRFDSHEVSVVVNPISLPFIKFERVNFVNFLQLGLFYQNELKSVEVTREASVMSLFRILKELSERYNYDKYVLFSIFDKHNRGKICLEDLESAFREMKVKYDFSSVKEAVELIGKGKCYLDLRDFCSFFDKPNN